MLKLCILVGGLVVGRFCPDHDAAIVAGADERGSLRQPQQFVDTVAVASVPQGVEHFEERAALRVPPFDGFVSAGADEAVEVFAKKKIVDRKPVCLDAVEGLLVVAVYLPDLDERVPAAADELLAVGQPA